MDPKKNTPKQAPSKDDYDDDNIPEIDTPKETNFTGIPDEIPRRDGPGGN